MDRTARARVDVRPAPTLDLLGLALAIAAIIAAFVGTSGSGSALSLPSSLGAVPSVHGAVHGEADGLVAGSASVFDDIPAVANLDSSLLDALRRAATAAARNGIELRVNSGWRSPEYQELLLRQAVSEYGSEDAAARWVGTAETSAHVSGEAVDIGPARATAWLRRHGARYALCQIYRNEPWHFELRPEAIGDGCPAMYADPTRDPRMQP